MIDMLKSIGIEKGKPFKPDAKTQDILNAAAREAHAWLDARYETVFPPYLRHGDSGSFPRDGGSHGNRRNVLRNRERVSRRCPRSHRLLGVQSRVKHLGAGQFYLMAIKDKDGHALDGGKHLSPDRAGECAGHAVLVGDGLRPRDPCPHPQCPAARAAPRKLRILQKNADGSVDVYFGPKAPTGKESNWIPTNPGGKFEVLFRFYGPEKPLFDKTWRLPDIEQVAAQ